MHLLSDEELVVKAQQNDATAIEELLKRYKYVVSAVAHSYFLTSGDKEDLLQEGMCAVFKAITTYNGKANLKSYVYTCVKNRIITIIKNSNANKNKPLYNYISLSNSIDADIDKSGIIVDSGYGPEETYINEEAAYEFSQKIKRALSEYEYSILSCFLKGYSQKDISEKLMKNEKSIDNALQRIKKKILGIVNNNN